MKQITSNERKLLEILAATDKPGDLVDTDWICEQVGITYQQLIPIAEHLERLGYVQTYQTGGSHYLQSIGILDSGLRFLGTL